MIEVFNLNKSYGTTVALDDVSFSVKKGQILGFLGANGAGKTSTMDIICGCSGADRGDVFIGGANICDAPGTAKSKIGYLPDQPPLYHDMLVRDFIRFAGVLRGIPKKVLNRNVDLAIEKLSLETVTGRSIGNLSKGYKQRVGLAQALVHEPEVLVLDEPTEGLDPTQIAQIRELIKSLKGEHTVILSSHILSEVESTCEEVVIIDRGKIIAQGSLESIRDRLQTGSSYKLRVQKDLPGLCEKLDQLNLSRPPALREKDVTVPYINLSLDGGGQDMDKVLSTIVSGGYGLLELSPYHSSLEEIFIQLTTDSIEED